MEPRPPRVERTAAAALVLLFALLALLAAWATLAAWALATAVRAPSRREWAGFAAVAVALRLAAVLLTIGRESPGDPHWYLVLARHLIAGQGLFVDEPALGARVHAAFPPAFPLLLAGWGAVAGLSAWSVLALSTLLDLTTAALIARLGRRLDEPRAGRAAAALYLVWPSVLLNAPLAQKESLELLLVVALALGWLGAGARARWRSAVTIGGAAGLLALTQPGVAALAGLIGLALLPRLGWRRVTGVGAGAAAVAAAVMAPWWIRNALVLHAFVPLTSVGGLSLWIGENPAATGNWMPYPRALAGLGEIDAARAAGRLAVEWMTAHPLDAVRLNAAKFVRAAGVGQFPVSRLDAMRPALAPGVAALLLPVAHGAHLLLLGAGAAAMRGRRRPALTALMLAVVLQVALVGVWFEFGERHRDVLIPFLLLSVAVAARGRAAIRPRTAPSAPLWAPVA